MERIVIPGRATKAPVALTDVILSAPVASRLLLGMTGPGNLVAAGAIGLYVGSAARDYVARRRIRPVDFKKWFGADVDQLATMPLEDRMTEVNALCERLDDGFHARRRPLEDLAPEVNRLLTRYIANLTGQEVITTDAVRTFTLARVVFPFALGACDAVSGDVAIFQDTGFLQPHVVAHEFAHRKGYLKELHAQVLAYLALRTSGDPELVQAARLERLHRQLAVIAGDDADVFHHQVDQLPLRPELRAFIRSLRPATGRPSKATRTMRAVYDQRMRLTGQNGLSDYDRGFTDFLYTFAKASPTGRPMAHAEL